MFRILMTVLCLGTLVTAAGASNSIEGGHGLSGVTPEGIRCEAMFKGDLVAEMGLGCSNGVGTSGGPNDCLVGVAAVIAPPFDITSHYYEIYTQVSPTITALSFILHTGISVPGGEIGRQAGLDWSLGGHTALIDPPLPTPTALIFFGHNQPQTNVGMRWGLDTSSGSAGTSYIRAPACGASAFVLLDQLGFPGNWCFAAMAGGPSPIELQSWGSTKAMFK